MNFFSMNGTKTFSEGRESHDLRNGQKIRQYQSLNVKLQVPIIDRGTADSWLGGNVRLPKAEFSKLANPNATKFMAQLHCGDMAAEVWNGLGPRTGWLAFFVADNFQGDCLVLYSETGPAETRQTQQSPEAKAGHARWPVTLGRGPSNSRDFGNDIRFRQAANRGLVPGMRAISAPCSRPFDWPSLQALLRAISGHLLEAEEQSNRLLLSETQAAILRQKALSRWSPLERRLELLRKDIFNAKAGAVSEWDSFAKRAENLARNSLLYSADAFDKQVSWLNDPDDQAVNDKNAASRSVKILAFLDDLEAKQNRYRAEQGRSEIYESAIRKISAAFSETATVVKDIEREVNSRAVVEPFSDAAVSTVLQRLSSLCVFGISSENGDWRVSGGEPVFERHNLIDYLQPRLMRSYWPERLSSALYWYCRDPSVLGASATGALEKDLAKYGGLTAAHIGPSQAGAPPKSADEINLLTVLPCEHLGWRFPKPLSFRLSSRDLAKHDFSKAYLV